MKRWKIYYGDGSTFSNEDGEYYMAPTLCVQAIVLGDEDVGRLLIHGFTSYWWLYGEWFGGDRNGEFQYDIKRGVLKYKVFGETISNKKFDEILKRAMTDDYFPMKSAIHPREINK